MRRLHPQITPSLVVSLLALFVALGGTAYAAIVVSSNSQVAQNTIAGHAPITGVHSNLISGSVNATDLSSAYKTSVKVHCPSGLIFAGDICVELNLRDAPFAAALSTCAVAGRRLPDPGELALAFEHLGAPQTPQWVASFANDSNGTSLTLVAGLMWDDASRTPSLSDATQSSF